MCACYATVHRKVSGCLLCCQDRAAGTIVIDPDGVDIDSVLLRYVSGVVIDDVYVKHSGVSEYRIRVCGHYVRVDGYACRGVWTSLGVRNADGEHVVRACVVPSSDVEVELYRPCGNVLGAPALLE